MSPTKSSGKGKKKESLTKKAPGAPKRFKSSYILFFVHSQDEIKKTLPPGSRTAPIVSKKASAIWRTLSDAERAYWDNEADKEKKRYITEKESYTGPWQVPCTRSKKDPTAPRRNPSAFLLYSLTKRTQLKKENPTMKTTEISRMLGQMWNEASDEEKRPFVEREELEREEYKKKMNDWKKQKELQDQEYSLKSLDSQDSEDDWSASLNEDKGHENETVKSSEKNKLSFPNDGDIAPTTDKNNYHMSQAMMPMKQSPEYSRNGNSFKNSAGIWNNSHVASPVYSHPYYHSNRHQAPPFFPLSHGDNIGPITQLDHRLSPIPIFHNDQDQGYHSTQGPRTSSGMMMSRHQSYSWPAPQPRQLYPQHKFSNIDQVTSSTNIPAESFHTKRNQVFQHNSELGCSPFGSYDELDTPIDPLPVYL